MRISTKLRYGLRAMIDLAMNGQQGPVFVQSIAERQEVSKKYLEHLLVALKGAGLVRSVRGSKGGYVLIRRPGDITVSDIAAAIGEQTAITDCVGDASVCSRAEWCAVRDLWEVVSSRVDEVFRETTLAQLATQTEARQQSTAHMYYI